VTKYSSIIIAVLTVCGLIGCDGQKNKGGASQQKASVFAAHQPGDPLPKECSVPLGRGLHMEFVLIPAGEFTMGSQTGGADEKPAHKVSIAKPFYLGKCEVTQKQWQTLMNQNLSRYEGTNNPVEHISWKECHKFLEALVEKWPANRFRLPSEAEWEYACRAGSTTAYCCGDDDSALNQYAWYEANSEYRTHPVGTKKANAWGLFDMHGNVLEWCADMYEGNYEGAPTDGSARTTVKDKDPNCVLRGGAYDGSAKKLRSSYRAWGYPILQDKAIGFRVALDAP
jgi:formylglycine-generating enzyme required for sulfatase activity